MNLIICSSPFQILVAQKIIQQYPKKRFYAMILMVSDNQKYRYYAQSLIDKCGGGDVYFVKKNRYQPLVLLDLLLLKLKGKKIGRVDDVYLASFDSILIQTLISGIRFGNLYTFDDGTANLVDQSYYYTQDRHTGFVHQLLKKLFNNPYDLHLLKKQSKKHYTVFNVPNVMQNTQYIPLYHNTQQTKPSELAYAHQKRIMIGQPIYEMNKALSPAQIKQKNITLTQSMIDKFAIDDYLPHPRENYRITRVKYIDTKFVAEDYFAQTIQDDTYYTFYTFCSGSVLPFVGVDNIKIVSLLPSDCPKQLLGAYELLKTFGICVTMIDVDDGE